MNRRNFLQLSTLLPTLGFAPALFANPGMDNPPLLIMIELKGGNDGLNTLIPVGNNDYYHMRPTLGIRANEAVSLGDGFAMHSALKPLQQHWQSGDMAWIHGLGYENPNRSHFRSIEIWESGSDADEDDTQGWIAKLYPDAERTLNGMVVGSDHGPLDESAFSTLIMDDARSFIRLTKRLREVRVETTNPALAHVLDVQNNVQQNSQRVIDILQTASSSGVEFPNTKFGQRLEQAAHLINNGLGAGVYKIELSGFDTHQNQKNRHNALLTQLAGGLDAFTQALQESGQWDNTLIMTYSEFGRRVAENKSGGTDHGTAAAHMVMGGRVKGGFHGTAPDLSALQSNDLVYTSDFRTLYNSVATQWLGQPSPWQEFGAFDLVQMKQY